MVRSNVFQPLYYPVSLPLFFFSSLSPSLRPPLHSNVPYSSRFLSNRTSSTKAATCLRCSLMTLLLHSQTVECRESQWHLPLIGYQVQHWCRSCTLHDTQMSPRPHNSQTSFGNMRSQTREGEQRGRKRCTESKRLGRPQM